VARRAGGYAVMRPAREMLFSVLSPEAKYKAKNFIDTVIYRGGDAISSWIYDGLKWLGLGVAAIALISAPFMVVWGWLGYLLGVKREKLNQQKKAQSHTTDVGGEHGK
jgi:AAA family ATP:ADP antiporter